MSSNFQERYDTSRPTYIRVNEKKFADLDAGTTILIPSAPDIDAEIRDMPSGELFDQRELRRRLAERHEAEGACPVMTGMNLRIVAELALQALDAGLPQAEVTPVWQVIPPKSPLASKLAGGPSRIAQLRREEP